MRVVIAPDSFGGTLTPVEVAEAIAAGWRRARPDDELVLRPMSDGGEGLLDAVEASLVARGRAHERRQVEVVDPRGLATQAAFLLLDDGQTALIESALACGLAQVPEGHRDPLRTTTWGVGQLITAAAEAGARRLLLGLGGSATVDGGAGALSGLGFAVTVDDGSGLKIGGEDLPRVGRVAPGWVSEAVLGLDEVILLADVRAVLDEAAAMFGPQKGADEAGVVHLANALKVWADVVERDFDAAGLRAQPGTGAAGGLGFALAGALGATFGSGATEVASLVGLPAAILSADLVVTGEGRLDATSFDGKVVGAVERLAAAAALPAGAVVGQIDGGESGELEVEVVRVGTAPGPRDHATEVAEAAERLALRLGHGPS